MTPMPEGHPMSGRTVEDVMAAVLDDLYGAATISWDCRVCGHTITDPFLQWDAHDAAVAKHEASHLPPVLWGLVVSVDDQPIEESRIWTGEHDELMTVISHLGETHPMPGTDGREWTWDAGDGVTGTARLVREAE